MSTDVHRFRFSRIENRDNRASEHAHQYINSVVFNCWPAIPPCKWDRTKKAILRISILLIIIVPVVVVPVLKVHSHGGIQSRYDGME